MKIRGFIELPEAPSWALKVPELLRVDDIIAAAVPKHHSISGIYFLLDHDHVVYVGQSRNVLIRLQRHRDEGEKHFDSYAVVTCPVHMMAPLEHRYIGQFLPKYNIMSKPERRQCS